MILDQEEMREQQWIEWLRCTFSIRAPAPSDPDTIKWALIKTPDPRYSMLIEGAFPHRCCIKIRYSSAPLRWCLNVVDISCGNDETSRWCWYARSSVLSWHSLPELHQLLRDVLPEMRRTQEIAPTHSDAQLIEQIMLILSAWEYFVDEVDHGVTHEKSPTTGRHS